MPYRVKGQFRGDHEVIVLPNEYIAGLSAGTIADVTMGQVRITDVSDLEFVCRIPTKMDGKNIILKQIKIYSICAIGKDFHSHYVKWNISSSAGSAPVVTKHDGQGLTCQVDTLTINDEVDSNCIYYIKIYTDTVGDDMTLCGLELIFDYS